MGIRFGQVNRTCLYMFIRSRQEKKKAQLELCLPFHTLVHHVLFLPVRLYTTSLALATVSPFRTATPTETRDGCDDDDHELSSDRLFQPHRPLPLRTPLPRPTRPKSKPMAPSHTTTGGGLHRSSLSAAGFLSALVIGAGRGRAARADAGQPHRVQRRRRPRLPWYNGSAKYRYQGCYKRDGGHRRHGQPARAGRRHAPGAGRRHDGAPSVWPSAAATAPRTSTRGWSFRGTTRRPSLLSSSRAMLTLPPKGVLVREPAVGLVREGGRCRLQYPLRRRPVHAVRRVPEADCGFFPLSPWSVWYWRIRLTIPL